MSANSRDQICVCICTFHRNEMLERLLRKIAGQETSNLFDVSVVVVDNDVAGPARDLVLGLGHELGLDITYDVESVRAIAAVRNHTLRLATGNFIAMIDDDEFPPSNWLLTMYRAIHTFDVNGVFGPVRPFFDRQPPSWLMRGQFSGAPAFPTGTLLRWQQTYTGNVLMKRDVTFMHNVRFDEGYTTGGEDQVFFRSAMDAGCRFVAVEEGAIYETVPPERWTKKYYLRRALVNGFNAHSAAISQRWSLSRITMPIKSAVAVCVYALILPFTPLLGDHVVVSVLEKGGHHLSRLFATVRVQLVKQRGF